MEAGTKIQINRASLARNKSEDFDGSYLGFFTFDTTINKGSFRLYTHLKTYNTIF